MAESIIDWLDRTKKLQEDMIDDEAFRLGTQVGKKLIGVTDDQECVDADIISTLTQAKEDEDEVNAEWIEEVEKMMQAYDKKKRFDDDSERPTFTFEGFEFDTQNTTIGDIRGHEERVQEPTTVVHDQVQNIHDGEPIKQTGDQADKQPDNQMDVPQQETEFNATKVQFKET